MRLTHQTVQIIRSHFIFWISIFILGKKYLWWRRWRSLRSFSQNVIYMFFFKVFLFTKVITKAKRTISWLRISCCISFSHFKPQVLYKMIFQTNSPSIYSDKIFFVQNNVEIVQDKNFVKSSNVSFLLSNAISKWIFLVENKFSRLL